MQKCAPVHTFEQILAIQGIGTSEASTRFHVYTRAVSPGCRGLTPGLRGMGGPDPEDPGCHLPPSNCAARPLAQQVGWGAGASIIEGASPSVHRAPEPSSNEGTGGRDQMSLMDPRIGDPGSGTPKGPYLGPNRFL